jgi:hypothetical protein
MKANVQRICDRLVGADVVAFEKTPELLCEHRLGMQFLGAETKRR